ncbi:hypothetical protein B0H14DRAFT_3491668 [Mycena olivaceomarginata]|nr:hypothetical protein B0H14DRAFT_3491668 [Mycena olivaceomarginata]
MEPVVLPRRARTRQHLDLYPWRAQHEPQDHNTYSWWSPIGEDARAEADAVRTPFTRKYLWRTDAPEESAARAAVQARLASIYAIAVIREKIQDTQFWAARADIDAALELMTDTFVRAWGPSFSRTRRAKRLRRLCRRTQEQMEAAQAHAAATAAIDWVGPAPLEVDDNNTVWGSGGGWSDGGWGVGSRQLGWPWVLLGPGALPRAGSFWAMAVTTCHFRALIAATWRLPTLLGVAWAASSASLAASPTTLTSGRGSNGGWSAELSVGNGSGAASTAVRSTMSLCPTVLDSLVFAYFNPSRAFAFS